VLAEREITADHERWQEPSADEQWSDSFYFGGGDGRGLAFYTRVGLRPNEGVTEGALGVWLPGQGFLLAFGREGVQEEIACGPAAFRCVAPLLAWELSFSGRGRLFERAEHVATARDRFQEVDVSGRLVFTAWTEPLEFRGGVERGVAARHYEQPGSVAGVLAVGERRHPLAGRGLRDHSWGVRDWQGVPYWRWFGIVLDPDTFLVVNNVGRSGRARGESVGGFLMRDGELAPVLACETESELDPELGCQRRFALDVTDERGRHASVRGEAIAVAPLRQRRDGRLTLVNEVLTEYDWDGMRVIGLSEYLVQQRAEGGRDGGSG
jgi:hypothetical protein